ncbi:MAG: hypothetical protein JWO52_1381 [Gammaproteobacteria bacterium]|nr:hypothetical protein [Gammaproteobacteria bacterium]
MTVKTVATGANTPSEDDADLRLWLGDASDRGQFHLRGHESALHDEQRGEACRTSS